MKRFQFFNRQRVNTKDLNDTQLWQMENLNNQTGVLLSPGLLRKSVAKTIGSIALIPNEWVITQVGSTAYVDISIATVGTDGLFAYDNSGNLIGIVENQTYNDTPPHPLGYEVCGNEDIPLVSGDGYYYFWVGYREIFENTTYDRLDKDGNVHKPEMMSGYTIDIVYSATAQIPPVQPVTDRVLIGSVHLVGTATTIDYTYVKYAGIKPEDVNITIDTSIPPATYANGEIKSLSDHINAIDDASSVSVINPHGTIASTFGAVSQADVSIDAQILKNGIVSCSDIGATGADYYSDTTEFQALIDNTFGALNVYINAPTYSKLMFNGRLYEASDLVGWTGTEATVTFTGGSGVGSDVEGWYMIYIDNVGTPPAVSLQLSKALSYPEMYQPEDNKIISLGYVFWKNSGGTIQLQKNELTPPTIPVGDPILPFYTWATLNSKQITKNVSPHIMHSENLMTPKPGGNNTLGYTSTSNNLNWSIISGTATSWSAWITGYNLDITLTIGSNGFKGVVNTYTKPRITDNYKALDAKNLYTLSFNYSRTNAFDNCYIVVNGVTYYLPRTDATIKRFWVVLDTYPSQIDFYCENTLTKSGYVRYSNLQLIEGVVPSDVFLTDTVYTSSVVLDTTVSRFRSSVGAMKSTEPRIKMQNVSLDNILNALPVNTKLLQYPVSGDTISAMQARNIAKNINTDNTLIGNMEIWFVQGSLMWEKITFGSKRFESRITMPAGMGTDYMYMYSSFSLMSDGTIPLGVWGADLPSLISIVKPTEIDLKTLVYNDLYNSGNIFDYWGIIIVRNMNGD